MYHMLSKKKCKNERPDLKIHFCFSTKRAMKNLLYNLCAYLLKSGQSGFYVDFFFKNRNTYSELMFFFLTQFFPHEICLR